MFEKTGKDHYGQVIKVGSVVTQVGSSGGMIVEEVKYGGEVLECRTYDGRYVTINSNSVIVR